VKFSSNLPDKEGEVWKRTRTCAPASLNAFMGYPFAKKRPKMPQQQCVERGGKGGGRRRVEVLKKPGTRGVDAGDVLGKEGTSPRIFPCPSAEEKKRGKEKKREEGETKFLPTHLARGHSTKGEQPKKKGGAAIYLKCLNSTKGERSLEVDAYQFSETGGNHNDLFRCRPRGGGKH